MSPGGGDWKRGGRGEVRGGRKETPDRRNLAFRRGVRDVPRVAHGGPRAGSWRERRGGTHRERRHRVVRLVRGGRRVPGGDGAGAGRVDRLVLGEKDWDDDDGGGAAATHTHRPRRAAPRAAAGRTANARPQ